MGLLLLFVGAMIVAILIGTASRGDRRPPAPTPPSDRSPTELAADDPIEALLRYGTPDDASHLADQGVDLGALGYRPPGDE